jgi:acetyl-CoA carboxylase carboxyltransferase component
MHISRGASAAYRREIEQADDPNAKRLEVEQRLQALTSPFRTAEATAQDIIDPATTRLRLVEFVRDAQRVLALPGAPSRIPYRP